MEKKRSKLGSYTSSSSGDSCDSLGQSGSVTSLTVATAGGCGHLFTQTLNSVNAASNSCAAQHGRGSTNAIALSAAAAATAPFNFQPILPMKVSPKHRKYSLTQQSQSSFAAHQPRKGSLQQQGSAQCGLPNLMQLLLGGAHSSPHNIFSNHHSNASNTHNSGSVFSHHNSGKDLNNNLSSKETQNFSHILSSTTTAPTAAGVPLSTNATTCGSDKNGRLADFVCTSHRTESIISFAQDSFSSSGSANQSVSGCPESYVPGRKKYSEPYLPGLLREELLGRIATAESSSSTNSSSVGSGSGNASVGSSMPSSTHFLSYLPFRRFSKRAQSDPWIAEKLQRSPYTSRRFTLGTDNFVFSDEVHNWFLFILFNLFSGHKYRFLPFPSILAPFLSQAFHFVNVLSQKRIDLKLHFKNFHWFLRVSLWNNKIDWFQIVIRFCFKLLSVKFLSILEFFLQLFYGFTSLPSSFCLALP